MEKQQSLSSSLNFNKISIKGSSQNFSSQNQKSDSQQNELVFHDKYISQLSLSDLRRQNSPREAANQNFDDILQRVDQSHLKKMKNERSQHLNIDHAQKEESKQGNSRSNPSEFSLAKMFERLKSSNGDKNVFYQYHQNNEEGGRIILQSLKEELAKPIKATEAEDSQDQFEFAKFSGDPPKLEDYLTTEVLGQGLHGLVIKLVDRDFMETAAIQRVRRNLGGTEVVKLYQKEDKKAFFDEAIILANVQQARRLGKLWNHNGSLTESRSYGSFETNGYYGLFMNEGLGSLGDFREYLKGGDMKLSEQELLVFIWALRDNCSCLHQINYCHRDIKPDNIIINSKVMPELIDYSLASKFSEAKKGSYGTLGYRLEDFEAIERKETQWQDHLKSNDYFALGKTILELAFPEFRILSVKDMRSKLQKLKTSGMKVVGEMLEIWIFGDIQSKEKIIIEERESVSTSLGEFPVENKLGQSEVFISNFNPQSIWNDIELLQEKHLQNFKAFMEEKMKKKYANQESRSKEMPTFLIPKQFRDLLMASNSEPKMFEEEGKWLQENFKNEPEQAVKKCKQVIDQLFKTKPLTRDSTLLSNLIAILHLNGCVDDAVSLSDKVLLLDNKPKGFEWNHWVPLNNAILVYFAASLDRSCQFFLDRCRNIVKYFKDYQKLGFYEELKFLYYFLPSDTSIEKANVTEIEIEDVNLILIFFRSEKMNLSSMLIWNYGYALSFYLDSMINETARSSFKKLVSDLNSSGSGREGAFNLLQFPHIHCVLFILVTFCQVFESLASSIDLGDLNYLKKECKEILSNQKIWVAQLLKPNNLRAEREFAKILLEYDLVYVVTGFFILYNIKYNMRPESSLTEKMDRVGQLKGEEVDDDIRKDQAKRNSEKQIFLDAIMSFLLEASETDLEYPIILEGERKLLQQMSILGTKIDELTLVQCEKLRVIEYGWKFSKKEKSISITSLWMVCQAISLEEIVHFFASSNMEKLKYVEKFRLGFTNDSEGANLFKKREIEEICKYLSTLALTDLKISWDHKTRISNEEFRPFSKFISTQVKLRLLRVKFDLSFINPDGIESFVNDLIQLRQLQELYLEFSNCPEIDSESLLGLILSLKKLHELKLVSFKIKACVNVTALKKPQGLPFELQIEISLNDANRFYINEPKYD